MEDDDVRVTAFVHDVELSDDLFAHVVLGFHVDDLPVLLAVDPAL